MQWRFCSIVKTVVFFLTATPVGMFFRCPPSPPAHLHSQSMLPCVCLIRENRHICLVIDNAASHRKIPLNNIQLHFLPPNTTSLVQAMDQGIICNFKHFYREQVLQRLVDALDAQIISPETPAIDISRRISLLDAIIMASSSWESVKATTIANCFRKAGFFRWTSSQTTMKF